MSKIDNFVALRFQYDINTVYIAQCNDLIIVNDTIHPLDWFIISLAFTILLMLPLGWIFGGKIGVRFMAQRTSVTIPSYSGTNVITVETLPCKKKEPR